MTYASTILADSPVAFYRLDESSGTTANDLTANGYNGTYNGTGVTLGEQGALLQSNDAAVLFDGAAGNVNLPSGLSPAGYSALTIEAWVQLSNTSFVTSPRIIANATTTSKKGISLGFNPGAASLALTIGNGTVDATATSSGFTFVAGVWYYVVGTWDGTTITLWVNGQNVGTAALSGTIAASTTNLGLAYAPVTASNYFPGLLDEVAIYNTALVPARLAVHYLAGLFGTANPTPVDNPYGFNLFHPSGSGVANMLPMIPQVLLDMQSKNQTWLRYQIPWSRIETSPGVYQFGALDAAVYAANAAGINLNFNIFNPPGWQLTRPSTDATFSFADITGSATFASAIAARYNGVFSVPNYGPMRITVLEIGNEDYDRLSQWGSSTPNTNQTRDEGGTFLAPVMIATVPAVAAVNSTVRVFPACVLKQDATHVATWLAGYYGGGAGPYTLMTHVHFYKSGGQPPTHGYTFDQAWTAVQAGNAAAGYPKMDIWITETGWPTTSNNHSAGDVVSAATQWSYWEYELDHSRLSGAVTHVLWYEIGTNDGDSVTQGGAVDGSVETYVQPTWTDLGNYERQHPSWGPVIPVTVGGVTVGGAQVALLEDTVQLSPRLDEHWQATFTVIDYTGTQFFQYGERVQFTDILLGTLYSGFVVDDQQDKTNTLSDGAVEHKITCIDNWRIPMKRTSNRLYTTPTYAGKIVADMISDVLAAEGVIANYATQTTSSQADWAAGTLSSVTATTNVGDGDLELSGNTVVSQSELIQTDWAANGTLSNVQANANGDLSLIQAARNWDNGDFSNQTLFGNGAPTQSVASGVFDLTCAKTSETRARMDFAGLWADGAGGKPATIGVDTYMGGIYALNGFTYRTTNWNNNDSTYAYAVEANLGVIQLKKGSNSNSGSNVTLASATISPTLSPGFYRLQAVVVGNVHTLYINGKQYLSYTDSSSPWTAPGYIALRNRNTDQNTNTNQYDNFGVMQSLTGTWTGNSVSITSIALIASSIIAWDTSLSTGGTITVQTSIDGGATYQTATNGGYIPGLTPGASGTGKSVIVKVTLASTTTAVLPDIRSLRWSVNSAYAASGSRISGPFDLSPVGRCGASFVSWNANLPTNTALGVDVSPDGLNWIDMSAQNGGPIPFINGQPDPTIDGFDSDTSANYTSGLEVAAGDTFAGRTVGSGWGMASSGQVWTLEQGTGTISVGSGEGQISTPTDSNLLILGTAVISSGILETRFTQGNAAADNAQIFARYQGVQNWYRLGLEGQTLAIQKKVQGTFTTLVQATVATTAGTFYWLKFTLADTMLSGKIWQDGLSEPIADTISVIDTAFSSGNYGLGGSASTATPIEFDSFTANLNVWTYDTASSRLIATSPTSSTYLNTSLAPTNEDLIADMDQSDAGGLVFNAVDSSDYYSLVVADNQASVGTKNLLSLYKTTGTPGSVTPVTLYGQNTASTTLPTANIATTSTGTGTTNNNSKIGTATGYGELWSQGNTAAWPALSTPPAPTGHGFLWDVTTLEGQQLAAGNWQPILRIETSVGSVIADLLVRAYIYHANNTYTLIGTVLKTSQNISTGNTIFTLPITGLSGTGVLSTGDKLYYDVWPNVTTNNTGSSAATLKFFMASVAGIGVANNAELVTAGYQAPGGGTPATSLLASAPISFVRGLKYRLRATMLDGVITAFFDGNQVLSYTDASPLGAGNVGLINNGGAVGSRFYQLWVQPLGDNLTGVSVYTRQRLSTTDTTVTPQVLDLTVAAFGPEIGVGTLIPSANYQYTFIDQNLNDLAKQSNYHCFIDPGLKMQFGARQGTPAPWIAQSNTIGQPSDIEMDSNLLVEVASDQYRNRQVLTGVTNSGPFSDPFVGDGSRTSFTLRYPIAAGTAPVIKLNNVAQSVGVKGSTGSQWYYAAGDLTIAQDTSGAALTSGDTLIVSYTGVFLDTIVVDNVAAQLALQQLEGGTGIVEAVEDVSQRGMTYAAGLVYAQQLLTRYCINGRTLTYLTQRNGLQVGMIQPVFIPEENFLDVQMLIQKIDITLQTQPNQTILYSYLVTASELANQAGWAKLFASGLLD